MYSLKWTIHPKVAHLRGDKLVLGLVYQPQFCTGTDVLPLGGG